MTKVHMTKEELAQAIKKLALDLYVKLEMDRIVSPARNIDEALGRLCLHAEQYKRRTGGLPVHIIILADGDKQVIDPETAEPELLRAVYDLLETVVNELWWREYRCQAILATLEHSCDRCFFNVGETEVVAASCRYRHRMCVYDFGVEVRFYESPGAGRRPAVTL